MVMNKKTLIQSFMQTQDPEQLLAYLLVIKALLLKYGKKLSFPAFLQGIQEVQPEIGTLIQLLEEAKLLTMRALTDLIRSFEAQLPKKQLDFVLESNDEEILPPLSAYLEKRFGQVKVQFKPFKADTLSVQMKGQGYVYKRSLDRDLDALLA